MQRPRAHQIDEQAQVILRAAFPSTWVLNEQYKDYAKDYLVEMGEDDGTITGGRFYIQLKGQERVPLKMGGKTVSFRLKRNHAEHFHGITDLPVFLVVVDVNTKKGW